MRAVILRATPCSNGASASTSTTLNAPPRIAHTTCIALLPSLAQGQQFLLRPGFSLARTELNGFHPVGAGKARIDAAQRYGHVGDLLVTNHGRDRLQVLVSGRPHPPATRPVVLSGDDEVMALAARRLHRRQTNAPYRQFVRNRQLERPRLHLLQALPDDGDGFEHFFHAHHHPRPHIATVRRDDLEIHAVVSGVGMVAPAINSYARSAGNRPDCARVFHHVLVGHSYSARALLDVFVTADCAHYRCPFRLQLVQHLAEFALQLWSDVPAHAAHHA